MKRKNGFTLIELLAVIVILAIIALIATPIIMNVINEAKKGAAKDSMYGYIETVELGVAKKMISNTAVSFSGELNLTTKDGNLYQGDTKVLDVNFKGTKPENDGTITLTDGRVTNAVLNFGGYEVNYDGNIATVKGESKPTPPSTPTPDLLTYEIGDQVQVNGLTGTFHVIKTVNASDTTALLLYDDQVATVPAGTQLSDDGTMKFYGSPAEQMLNENTKTWKTSIEAVGGKTEGMVISVPSKEELQTVRTFYGFTNDTDNDTIEWLHMGTQADTVEQYFTKTVTSNGNIIVYDILSNCFYELEYEHFIYGSYIRPTLLINKSNLTKVA